MNFLFLRTIILGILFLSASAYGNQRFLEKMKERSGNFTKENCDFTNLNLMGFDITHTVVEDIDLFNIVLDGATVTSSWFEDVGMKDASCKNADFRFTILDDVDLDGADCSGADFRGATLEGDTNLTNTILANAKYDEYTDFPEGFDPQSHGMKKYDTSFEEYIELEKYFEENKPAEMFIITGCTEIYENDFF